MTRRMKTVAVLAVPSLASAARGRRWQVCAAEHRRCRACRRIFSMAPGCTPTLAATTWRTLSPRWGAAVCRLNAEPAVQLHREAIDLRKNINGLAALVQHELGLNSFAGTVYVFTNRRRDRVKILGWSRSGFWLLHNRLEQDRFVWPRRCSQVVELTVQQLHWLLGGIDLAAMRGHGELKALRAA